MSLAFTHQMPVAQPSPSLENKNARCRIAKSLLGDKITPGLRTNKSIPHLFSKLWGGKLKVRYTYKRVTEFITSIHTLVHSFANSFFH